MAIYQILKTSVSNHIFRMALSCINQTIRTLKIITQKMPNILQISVEKIASIRKKERKK